VDRQPLAHRRADGHSRIERRERVLEDDLHLAPEPAQLRRAKGANIHAVEANIAARRLDQAENRTPGRGLAAARLPDQAKCLTRSDIERHPVNGADSARLTTEQAALDGEVLDEIVHRQERRSSGGRSRRG
jgi:hypothetical protein